LDWAGDKGKGRINIDGICRIGYTYSDGASRKHRLDMWSRVEPSREIEVGILDWAIDKGKGRMNIDNIVELETHIQMGFFGNSAWTYGAE
jgi:hypothetical protein